MNCFKNNVPQENTPSLQAFLSLRSNETAYLQFCYTILPLVLGRKVWKLFPTKTKLTKIASPTDEAWGLLVLENNWEMWEQQARCRNKGIKWSEIPKYEQKKTKWTHNSIGRERFLGWDSDGVKRFNELTNQICEDRAEHEEFDSTFYNYFEKEENERKNIKNKENNHVIEIGVVANDIDFLMHNDDLIDVEIDCNVAMSEEI